MRLVSMVLALLTASSASASDIQCYGTVDSLLILSDGTVNLKASYRGEYTNICNLKAPRLGVDTFTCALWVGVIEGAWKVNQTIHTYYVDNGTGFTCSTIPFYGNAPAPLFIGHGG